MNDATAPRNQGGSKGPASTNVLGSALDECGCQPMTGYFRDGYCRTDGSDRGRHVVCAVVTQAFLEFTRKQGNDLSTPRPEFGFPGLKPGDRWCLCALRWLEAAEAGCAPSVILSACEAKTLEFIPLALLKEHSLADA